MCLFSITEEEPGPLRGVFELKSENKMSRTFSYLKSKMYKKSRVSYNQRRVYTCMMKIGLVSPSQKKSQ